MKFKLPLIAAMFAVATLSACGGSSSSNPAPPQAPVYSPAALSTIDTQVGAGATASAGKTVKVHYTGYLYNTTVTNFKGAQFETSAGNLPYEFVLGTGKAIAGFDQGVTGMQVGGKRTVLIPASLAYGASGSGKIPPNSGLVFDLELVEVK